jgi:hypothetical protein
MKFAFYRGQYGTHLDHLITWRTNGPYSHCEAVIEERGGNLCHCASSSIQDGGVRFKDIALDAAKWDVIEVAAVDVKGVLTWFTANEGLPYDAKGAMNFLFPMGEEVKGYFCSEAIAEAIGMKDAWRFEPNALAAVLELLGGIWVSRTGL